MQIAEYVVSEGGDPGGDVSIVNTPILPWSP